MIELYIVDSRDVKIQSQLHSPKNLKEVGASTSGLGNIRQVVLAFAV